jgi:hypothetical protein
MSDTPAEFVHTRRIHIVHPDTVMTLTTWMHAAPDEVSAQEADLLAGAHHFGLPIVWGFVSQDPLTGVWCDLIPRPVIACFHALHVAEA